MNKETISGENGEKEYTDKVFTGLTQKGKAVTTRRFYGCTFRNCEFTGAEFRFCRFIDCRFESCNLSLVKVTGSSFSGTSFRNSKLAGVNWTEAAWSRIKLPAALRFESCVLSDSSFLGLSLRETGIVKCLAKDADFREADLSMSDLSGTDLSGALFGRTNLSGANLDQARNYTIRPADNILKGAKFSMPEAMALLYCLDIKMV